MMKDKVIEEVIKDLTSRSNRGIQKYNTTLEMNNKNNFIIHAYEEVLDLGNYLKKIILQKEEIQDLIQQYPNDQELGEVIRKIYGKKKLHLS